MHAVLFAVAIYSVLLLLLHTTTPFCILLIAIAIGAIAKDWPIMLSRTYSDHQLLFS